MVVGKKGEKVSIEIARARARAEAAAALKCSTLDSRSFGSRQIDASQFALSHRSLLRFRLSGAAEANTEDYGGKSEQLEREFGCECPREGGGIGFNISIVGA